MPSVSGARLSELVASIKAISDRGQREVMYLLRADKSHSRHSALSDCEFYRLNWLQVFQSAEAARSGHSEGQQVHTSMVRSEKCLMLRVRAWERKGRDRRIFWPATPDILASHVSVSPPLLQKVRAIRKTCNQL